MTHLSQATCARIAELVPDKNWIVHNSDGLPCYEISIVLSKRFLIAALGDWKVVARQCEKDCKSHDGYVLNNANHWHYGPQQQGHKLLEAYWTSGVTGCEALLLELLEKR